MSKLAQLKKNRGKSLKNLQEKLEQSSGGGGAPRDERIWKPAFNKDKGKGTAIVRFLTPQAGDPFVEVKSYSFSGNGGNFWGTALQTVGKDDPVQLAAISAFRKAKNDGDQRLREQAKKWLPNSQFYANVYIVKDEENPENEGKVKIMRFGRQIFGFIEKALKPEFDDQEPMDPFDFWEGAELRIRMIGKEIPDSRNPGQKVLVPNYENSEFARPSEFMDGDEDKIEEVLEQTHDLSEFIDESKIKSFEEQAELFKKAMGFPYNWLSEDGLQEHVADKAQERRLEEEQDNDDGSQNHREKPAQTEEPDDSGDDSDDGEEEDALAKFKRLANKG